MLRSEGPATSVGVCLWLSVDAVELTASAFEPHCSGVKIEGFSTFTCSSKPAASASGYYTAIQYTAMDRTCYTLFIA